MKRILLGMGVGLGLLVLPAALPGQGYIGPEEVPYGAGRVLKIMGDRLQVEGKERLDLLAVLTRAGENPVGVRILWEFPGKVRIEKRLGTDGEELDPNKDDLLVYDGAGNLRKKRGTAGLADQDLIEMLVHDSVEGFFIGQLEGFATRLLGSRYHREDDAGNAVGPDYDIYEVINEVRVPGRPLRQRKLYYFNSDTALLERVRYRLSAERGRGAVKVSVEVSGWGEVFGQLIPGKVVRYENGVEVVKLEIQEAGIAAAAEDGSFEPAVAIRRRTVGMRTGTRRGLAAAAMGLGWLCLAVPGLWGQGKAAGKAAGERGFVPTGSYQLGEIETVNSKNGNVLLLVPLASLPPGRGGNPGFALTLNYNSKLRDFLVRYELNPERRLPGQPFYLEAHEIGESFGSPGWRYNYDYRVDVQDRNQHRGQYPQYCDGLPETPGGGDDFIDKHWYRFQVRMVFPDGSVHEFRPVGEDDRYGDSYFRILPTGWRMKDRGHCQSYLNALLGWDPPRANTNTVYYSIDGSYLRLEFEPDPPPDPDNPPTVQEITKWQDNPWTLTFPDGRQVKGLGLMANRFLDPNDSDANAVTISRLLDDRDPYDGDPYDLIRDEAGRTIRIDPGENQRPDPNRQTIRRKGADGEELTWTVEWGETRVNRTYAIKKIRHDESGSPTQTTNTEDTIGYIAGNLRMVTRIVLPSELGGLDYEFTYNGTESNPSGAAYAPHSRGLGELRTATMPWGAKATYTYVQDYADMAAASMVHKAQAAAENAITAKSLSYATGFGTETLTEDWDYQIAPNSQAIITTPGGGKTRETYGRNAAVSGLLAKVEYCEEATIPVGGTNCLDSKLSRVMEREWAYNIPAIGSPGITRASMLRANPYVKSEYRTEQGKADKTGVVDYTYDKNGNLTRADEYDWVNYTAVHDSSGNPTTSRGTRLRTTAHTYQAATPTATNTATPDDDAYYDPDSARRLRLRATTEVREGGGTKRSRRQFTYDTRGNLTGEKIGKSNASGVVSGTLTSANSFTISHTYDSRGHSNRTSTTDGEGNVARWTYGAITGSGSPSISQLYPTRVVEASGAGVARTMNYGYNFHTGQVTSATDADNGVSTLTELDDVGRAILVKEASGKSEERRTQSWYCDEKRRMIVRSDLGAKGDGKLVTVTDYDGLGRVRLARSYEGEGDAPPLPTGSSRNAHCSSYDSETAGIKVETHYLRSGTSSYTIRSSPYRGATAPTMTGWTRIKLDHLGRVVQAGLFSGASKPSTSAAPTLGTTATAYDGEYTTATDPANKKRRSKRDGLGRLVRVDEPDSSANLGTTGSPNQKTDYSYSALDNLTRVTQGSQTRTFVYDSLSRLTSATNPERGTIAYSYDNNGNLTQRTDARGVVTAYTYDRLDRLTRRAYSYTGSDTAVSLETTRVDYAYDRCGSYSRGRLCSVTAGKGATDISRTAYNRYDALGRVLESTQTTGGQAYTMAYAYDRAGNLTSQRYPSDRVVDYAYDGAGRIAGAKTGADGWYAGGTGTNAVEYEPHGGVKQLLLGNGLWEQRRYNARLQPTQIGLGTRKATGSLTATGPTPTAGLLLLDYTYGTTANNGNVLSQRIRVGSSFNQNQAYTYDALNRLKTAAESGSGAAWSQTYAYDRYGNRRVTAGAAHGSNQALTPQSTADIAAATNRLAGTKGVNTVAYDAAGNLTADWAANAFKYDGDNRLVAFDAPLGTDSDTAYAYDGEGRRVRKVVGGSSGVTTTYVYNVLGQLVAEFGGTASEQPGTRYLTPDHLGSTRVVTGEDQSVLSRHDYLPFGEEIGAALGNRDQASGVTGYTASLTDGPAQKFTGKERDAESGLDYFQARYFSGAGGRFTSADAPLVDQFAADPGSWNLYTYTRNNPLRFIDPTGRECITLDNGSIVDDGQGTLCEQVSEGDREEQNNPSVTVHTGSLSVFAEAFVREMDLRASGTKQLIFVGAAAGVAGGVVVGAGATAGAGYFTELTILILARAAPAIDPNSLHHIFGKAKHNLDGLVRQFGSRGKAFEAIANGVRKAVRSGNVTTNSKGVYKTTVRVKNEVVTVRGRILDGEVNIGTAFKSGSP